MLDYDNFEVMEILPQDEDFAATIMHDKRPDAYKPWCVQYRGSGRYFFSEVEMHDYMRGRGWI